MNLPIIRLEVKGMRQQIAIAFTQFQLSQDAMVKDAIAKVCTPENVQRVIDEAVEKELESGIRTTVEDFYRYGDGRKLVTDLVIAKLKKKSP